MKQLTVAIILLLFAVRSTGQIYLINPSFEGEPQDATVPAGWLPCEPGTTPDILPGVWGVYQEASNGNTFVGLITRENSTWESIGQRLKTPVEAGQCHTFTLELAHSKTYAGYNKPLKLRVWGGVSKCGKDQLLFESPLIEHREWKRYKVEFSGIKEINYITLEAFHQEGAFFHQGNILIDNISPIKRCVRA